MTASLIVLLALLLLVAAWGDVRARIIPNRLNLAIALMAPLYWWTTGLAPWPGMAMQVAVAAMVFALFAGVFAAGLMGGGDVKLIGALALWLPWRGVIDLLVLTAVLGGAVTLATLLVHRLRRAAGTVEVPYGVAIALAAVAVLGEPYLYQFA